MHIDDVFPLDLTKYPRVVFFTGAGMSAECGVPTYRGHGGIWSTYNYEDYACENAFRRQPEHVWDFHDVRRQAVQGCAPLDGHRLLARLQKLTTTSVITQNIDGMHQRAGATDVVELHGSLWRVRCDVCGVIEENLEAPISDRRHRCGHHWRPDIVWFGDALRQTSIDAAVDAMRTASLVVSIGTSAVVYPAAELPKIAKRAGATLVEVNPAETDLSHIYDVVVRSTAEDALARLLPFVTD